MGREGGIEDGGQSFLGTRTCVTQTCTKDQVVPELGDGEVGVGRWGLGGAVARENEIREGGSPLALEKFLLIRIACGRPNFYIFGQLWEKNSLSVVQY